MREKQAWIEELVETVLSVGVRPVQAKAANAAMRQAILSPDGKTLFVVGERTDTEILENGDWDTRFTPLGLQAWDVKSGTRLLNVETAANEIRWGPGGKILLNGFDKSSPEYQPFTDVFDPTSGEIAAHLELTYAYSTPRLDGRLVLVSAYAGDEGSPTWPSSMRRPWTR